MKSNVVTGYNRCEPAYGFCLRPEKIYQTETQHCFYLLQTLFPYKKITNKTKTKAMYKYHRKHTVLALVFT